MTYLTESGIAGLGKVPWGSHFCQLYATQRDLAELLIPYFTAGLRHNERCIWITASPYEAAQAREDLSTVIPDLDTTIARGQLDIINFNEWYATMAGSLNDGVLSRWLEEEDRALAGGYEGLRISGNTSFLAPETWNAFMTYEDTVQKTLTDRRIVALCSYCLGTAQVNEIFDVARAHHFTLHQRDAGWEILTLSPPLP